MRLSGLFNGEWFKHQNRKTDDTADEEQVPADPAQAVCYGLVLPYISPDPWPQEEEQIQPTLPMYPPPTVAQDLVQANADERLQEIVEELEQLPRGHSDDPYQAIRGGQAVEVVETEQSIPDMSVEEAAKPEEMQNVQNLEQIVEDEFRLLETTMQQAFEQKMEDPYEQQLKMYAQQMHDPFMMPDSFGPPPM
jgi:hypothetical protein